MLIYCKYSGVEFETPQFPGLGTKNRIFGIHPIFLLERDRILARTRGWILSRHSEAENRLLFLALLKSSALVTFDATAMPTTQTVQNNMERLVRFTAWHMDNSSPRLKLPEFIIRAESASLGNINIWLQMWETAKEDYMTSALAKAEKLSLFKREATLHKQLKTATQHNQKKFNKALVAWALEAGNVPPYLHKLWSELMLLEGLDIYKARTEDLEELVEHMLENLDHYQAHIYAKTVMDHCRTLLEKNKAGIFYAVSGNISLEELNAEEDLLAAAKSPFEIVEETREVPPAPVAESFSSNILYLKAMAKWKLEKIAIEKANSRISAKAAQAEEEHKAERLALTAEEIDLEEKEDLNEELSSMGISTIIGAE